MKNFIMYFVDDNIDNDGRKEGRNKKPTEHAAQMKGNGYNVLIGKFHKNYWKEIMCIYIYIYIYMCVCVCVYICNDKIEVFLNENGSD